MNKEKLFCLTLDLENDWYFDDPKYDHLVFEYLDDYIDLMKDIDVSVSFFVVGDTLERYPEKVHRLEEQLDCEFHLHSYSHDLSKSYDFEVELNRAISAYEDYFGKRPIGYRAPQGNINSDELLELDRQQFQFDSSVFPSYRPGVYNNIEKPTSPYRPDGVTDLVEIPLAVCPRIRIPISQSYLKLFGRPYINYLKRTALPQHLVFNTHLHDFYRTDSHDKLNQPKRFLFKRNLESSVEIFREFMNFVRTSNYSFVKISELVQSWKESEALLSTEVK